MKRTILMTFVILCTMTVNGQLKVTGTGNVYINKTTQDGHETLGVGDDPSLYVGDFDGCNIGIHVQKYNTTANKECYGIYSYARQSSNTNSQAAVGVFGYGDDATAAKNFGVVGTISIGQKGAGVAGTTEAAIPPPLPTNSCFAGYFYGDVYVDEGTFTVTDGFYNLSDMRLKEDVVLLSDKESESGKTIDNLLGLNVFEYKLKRPRIELYKNKELDERAIARMNRRHYGVSAQELKEIFPNLVVEGQDGYLTVNYTEMVPILLHCIQELKEEIDEMKGSDLPKSVPATDEIQSKVMSNACLFQNTPNPFNERTEIRFSLPDDTQNANICVFDMSGKMLKQIPVTSSMQSVTINGYELAAGMYLYSLVVGGQEIDTKRMILSK